MRNLLILSFFVLANIQAFAEKNIKIRIGASPVLSTAGIFLAHENGHFLNEGLNVEIVPFRRSGAPMTLLLANGELEVGGGNLSSGLWNAIAQGQKIKLVADKGHISKGHSYISLIVRKDLIDSGKFKTLKDLKGFRMGLTALNGVSQQIAAERVLNSAGLKLSDVSFQKMSYGEMNVALAKKLIDATIQLEPFVAKAEVDGIAKVVATLYDYYPDQQSAAIFFAPHFTKNNQELAKKFIKAYILGVRDYENAFIYKIKKDETIKKLMKHIQIEDKKVWEKTVPIGLNTNGYINSDSLLNDLKWYKKQGYIDSVPDLKNIVDDSYVKAAIKEIGNFKKPNGK
ncbi:MAG: ABC transporter substrate-binding protein [Bdellovibrionales bacterium]|nr:ABC transporter substrate-binding protein [Bdellovibrionales bacterium]